MNGPDNGCLLSCFISEMIYSDPIERAENPLPNGYSWFKINLSPLLDEQACSEWATSLVEGLLFQGNKSGKCRSETDSRFNTVVIYWHSQLHRSRSLSCQFFTQTLLIDKEWILYLWGSRWNPAKIPWPLVSPQLISEDKEALLHKQGRHCPASITASTSQMTILCHRQRVNESVQTAPFIHTLTLYGRVYGSSSSGNSGDWWPDARRSPGILMLVEAQSSRLSVRGLSILFDRLLTSL